MQRGPMTSIVVSRIVSMLGVTYYEVRVHRINTNHILQPICRPLSRRCRPGGLVGPSMVGGLLNAGYPFSFAAIALSLCFLLAEALTFSIRRHWEKWPA